jgi:hypothetical protein
MRHMSLFVFSSLFALSLVMALPSKVNGESHSLDLDPLYKMFANGVQLDVHKTSHAFKRCAALLYGLYQLSSNQSDHFRDILLTQYVTFVFLIRRTEKQIIDIPDEKMADYIEKNIAPYVYYYVNRFNKSYLERGNYTSDALVDADISFCGKLNTQLNM